MLLSNYKQKISFTEARLPVILFFKKRKSVPKGIIATRTNGHTERQTDYKGDSLALCLQLQLGQVPPSAKQGIIDITPKPEAKNAALPKECPLRA